MIGDYRVVVFTPWGRELTASLLHRYLKRDHDAGVVDEWHLWMNTDPDQTRDIEYAHELAEQYEWTKTFERPPGEVLWPKQMNTGKFYTYTQDENTIYVRMDDDIVWIEPHAISRLVEYRISNKFPFVVFPIIWNNAVCSHYLQLNEQMPLWWGKVDNHCMNGLGWADPYFAEKIHNHLFYCIEHDLVDKLFMHTTIQLPVGHQFSVSSFAQFGSEYKKVHGDLQSEEEAWHSMSQPFEQQRPNVIVPNSLISHFSFYPQRHYLLTHTNILDRYKELAETI